MFRSGSIYIHGAQGNRIGFSSELRIRNSPVVFLGRERDKSSTSHGSFVWLMNHFAE